MSIQDINNTWDDIERVQKDLSQGHVSVQEASSAVTNINKAWDDFAKNFDNSKTNTNALAEAVKKNHPYLFAGCGEIKKGAVTGMESVSSFFNAVDSFKGSWRNPAQARQKLESGLNQITTGVTKLGETISHIGALTTTVGASITNKFNSANHPVVNGLGGGLITSGAGIGLFGAGLSTTGTAFAKSGIIGLAGRVTQGISGVANGNRQGASTGSAAMIGSSKTTNAVQKNTAISTGTTNSTTQSQGPNATTSQQQSAGTQRSGTSGTGISSEDYSADIVYEINIVLDGGGETDISCCTINGVRYRLSSYNLTQSLLEPMLLSFSMEKENKEETQQDVIFADATKLIGKSVEINVTTIKSSQDDSNATPEKAFVFKGMVIDVSASRATASAQSASITAATYDSIMQNAPHCRSFENNTLQDIVSEVLKPYSDITSIVNPRFTEKIPYLVQYNQSDYAFVRMLAIRFGEWMYNTGEKFVFGEMDNSNGSAAKLEYPGGSLMSYSLSQNMSSFAFNHLLSNHYKFGHDDAIKKLSGKNEADGNLNDWTEKAYQASQQRLSAEHIISLSAGGFDNSKDDEGAENILNYSIKIESIGTKTGLMTVSGSSKLAMLKIGQQFLVCDNVQNISGQNQDVQQNALVVIGISHSFDYKQEYSNTFTAIPAACKYPAYSNANVHAIAPSQRAKVVDNKDEQKLGRIRVQFPWQEIQNKEMKSPWLRIAVPYAGKEKGHQFIPEIGEEVMVGFEMDNAERPYIIGALYNGGEGKPDEKWSAAEGENDIKAIRTRNGHTILFNDKGDAGFLEIYDNKNNTYHITLSADDKKITIYSAGDIEINADGSIAINSKENISIEANKKVSVQASKVEVR